MELDASSGVRCSHVTWESRVGEEKRIPSSAEWVSTSRLSAPPSFCHKQAWHSEAALLQTHALVGMELGGETGLKRDLHILIHEQWGARQCFWLDGFWWTCVPGNLPSSLWLKYAQELRGSARGTEVRAGLGVGDYSLDTTLVQVPSRLQNLAEMSHSPRGLP